MKTTTMWKTVNWSRIYVFDYDKLNHLGAGEGEDADEEDDFGKKEARRRLWIVAEVGKFFILEFVLEICI